MLTYERYQALRAINIRVPGEPGNEAKWEGLGGITLPKFMRANKVIVTKTRPV